MKTTSLLLFFVSCLLAGSLPADDDRAAERGKSASSVTIKGPSDLRANGIRGSTSYSLDFIIRPVRDFRKMYCDAKTLNARILSNVCVMDVDSGGGSQTEIKIQNGASLKDILKNSPKLQEWQPGWQPEIRIITKRAILADNGKNEFLRTKISPGDFIVILKITE